MSGSQTISEHGDGEIVTAQAAIGFDLLGEPGAWVSTTSTRATASQWIGAPTRRFR